MTERPWARLAEVLEPSHYEGEHLVLAFDGSNTQRTALDQLAERLLVARQPEEPVVFRYQLRLSAVLRAAPGIELALGCAHTKSACPASYQPDAQRTAHLRELLQRDPEGRLLLASEPASICYARGGAGVTTDDALLLDAAQSDARLAARVAQLLSHRAAGQTRTSGTGPDEADANALEQRVLSRMR